MLLMLKQEVVMRSVIIFWYFLLGDFFHWRLVVHNLLPICNTINASLDFGRPTVFRSIGKWFRYNFSSNVIWTYIGDPAKYGNMFNVISSIYFYILGVDTNDVPLLMSIATAHTPILNERYSFNFSY